MTDMTSNEIEIDSFTRPDDIVASVGKKVRIHYHLGRNTNLLTRVGWVVDGGGARGWGVANTRDAEGPAWRLFDTDARPESGLWSGIERVALLSEESDRTEAACIAGAHAERIIEADAYRENVAKVINDLIESEDMDDDLADHLRDALDIEEPKQKPVTIEWTVTVTATGTPTSRDVAKKLSDGFVDDTFIENLLFGLGGVDVDESMLTVDPWNGIHVSIEQTDVS